VALAVQIIRSAVKNHRTMMIQISAVGAALADARR
jgi:hypothetical protein